MADEMGDFSHGTINASVGLSTKVYQPKSFNSGTLALAASDGVVLLPVQQITRLQADGGYTYVHQVNGKPQFVCKRIGELHRLLPIDNYFRCHHKHVINLGMVTKLIHN